MLPASCLVAPHLLLNHFPGPTEDPKRTSPFLSTWQQLPYPSFIHIYQWFTSVLLLFPFPSHSLILPALVTEKRGGSDEMLSLALLHTKISLQVLNSSAVSAVPSSLPSLYLMSTIFSAKMSHVFLLKLPLTFQGNSCPLCNSQ